MAAFVLSNASVLVGIVDLSDHVRSVTVDYSAETPETTTMGAVAKARLGGLLDWKADVEFNMDYAVGEVHATLYPILGTTITLTVQPVAGTEGATNPKFVGSAILAKYNPLTGKVGDVATTKAEFVGTGLLTLDIAP